LNPVRAMMERKLGRCASVRPAHRPPAPTKPTDKALWAPPFFPVSWGRRNGDPFFLPMSFRCCRSRSQESGPPAERGVSETARPFLESLGIRCRLVRPRDVLEAMSASRDMRGKP
jgi:hypothetical protein